MTVFRFLAPSLPLHYLLWTCLLCGLLVTTVQAQEQRPRSQREAVRTIESVARTHLSALDNAALRAQHPIQGVGPLHFAVPRPTALRVEQDGTWEELDGDTLLWRLRVQSEGAESLNLGFTEYHLPPGAELFLYTPDQETVIGPFTAKDNAPHGELWTPVLPGDEAVVEVTVPAAQKAALRLKLGRVNHGFRSIRSSAQKFSGACNIDVACEEADAWRDEVRSVATYSIDGRRVCSGVLVNNTANDHTPYFLTAAHCDISPTNAASVVVYWNFENSTCRPPGAAGGPGDGTLDEFTSGAIYRASYAGPSPDIGGGPDFTLIELDEPINPAYDVHFAGWNHADEAPFESVTIHHPSVEEKRISFDFDPATITSYLDSTITDAPTHLRVGDWDVGTTEPGSSGSPLFDSHQRIVGILSGGYAACGNNDPDWYGRLAVAWDGGGTPETRLRDWLDPLGTNSLTENGIDLEQDLTPPAAVSDLTIEDITSEGITLRWTATGDDGSDGTASAYELRYSTAPIRTLAAFDTARVIPDLLPPQPAGSIERFTVRELRRDTPYYFALLARDNVNNTSPLAFTEQNAVILSSRFTLHASYPNPFRTTTTVGFAVEESQRVRVDLYDALGRRVQHLYDDRPPANSLQRLRIDGGPLASGVYFVRLVGKNFARTTQIVRAR